MGTNTRNGSSNLLIVGAYQVDMQIFSAFWQMETAPVGRECGLHRAKNITYYSPSGKYLAQESTDPCIPPHPGIQLYLAPN